MSDTQPRPARPAAAWIVCLILCLQGAAVIITTISSVLASAEQVLDAAGQVALVVLYVLAGLVLILLGTRIFSGAGAARTPTMVLQLLVVVLSFSFFAGGTPLAGVLFLVPAATTLVLLFITPMQDWLAQSPGRF